MTTAKKTPTETFHPTTRAVVRLVVEYDTMPSDTEVSELLDSARNYGGIKSATMEILGPVKRDLLGESL